VKGLSSVGFPMGINETGGSSLKDGSRVLLHVCHPGMKDLSYLNTFYLDCSHFFR